MLQMWQFYGLISGNKQIFTGPLHSFFKTLRMWNKDKINTATTHCRRPRSILLGDPLLDWLFLLGSPLSSWKPAFAFSIEMGLTKALIMQIINFVLSFFFFKMGLNSWLLCLLWKMDVFLKEKWRYYRWRLRVPTSTLEADIFWAVLTSDFHCPLNVHSYTAGNKASVETH